MKSTEFVKKFGWFATTRLVNGIDTTNDPYFTILLDDLKRLVESYELVEKCGGLNSLKAWVKETKSKLSLATYFHCDKPYVLIQIENAEQAIADVEACQ